jgi:hypothetical protein
MRAGVHISQQAFAVEIGCATCIGFARQAGSFGSRLRGVECGMQVVRLRQQ